ncbi:protein extra-macrochaetae [Penaeus vannamei]|uniref:protein extra-macrochaetae n=1 Tax=Penaeus vannamei TaxID=6689 RepID=UPI000F6608AD|nr:protein extra-macrochaetae-like [Penaeus vannamei]
MKAQRCVSPVQAVMGVMEGKVGKLSAKAEATQVLMYMDRLQQLVPQCPKDRPVSRLELIQSVIDYIYDLEEELAHSPETQDQDKDDNVFEDEPSRT